MLQELVTENLKHRPLRTVLSILAIAVEVTLILTIVGISRGMLADTAGRIKGTNAHIIVKGPGTAAITSGSAATMPASIVPYFAGLPHVRAVAPALIHPVGGLSSITGVDFQSFENVSGGLKILEGRMPASADEVLIDPGYARQNKKKPGDIVTFVNNQFRVAGVMEGGKLAQVLVNLQRLQELTSNTKITQVMIRMEDDKYTDETVKNLQNTPELKGYLVLSIDEFASMFRPENLPGLQPFINVVIGISLIVGFLTISLTMYTAVLERTREIGILKSLGASPVFILRLLFRESVLLAVLGTIMGILLTYGAKFAIDRFIPSSMKQMIVYDWWPIALVIAIMGAILGTLYPGLKAIRQDAIEALSYE